MGGACLATTHHDIIRRPCHIGGPDQPQPPIPNERASPPERRQSRGKVLGALGAEVRAAPALSRCDLRGADDLGLARVRSSSARMVANEVPDVGTNIGSTTGYFVRFPEAFRYVHLKISLGLFSTVSLQSSVECSCAHGVIAGKSLGHDPEVAKG